jgi:hypothetical protein
MYYLEMAVSVAQLFLHEASTPQYYNGCLGQQGKRERERPEL